LYEIYFKTTILNPVTDIIILAAGNSSRLGRAKQLLLKDGKTLINHTIEAAEKSVCRHVYLVTGAYKDLIHQNISSDKVIVLYNQEWEKGMSSSIDCGIREILQQGNRPDAVIFLLCDQPFISASLINDLVETHKESGKKIVNCDYGQAFGPPVLFHQSLFEELTMLQMSDGAKEIVRKYKSELSHILFPEGIIDIDYEDDVVKYL